MNPNTIFQIHYGNDHRALSLPTSTRHLRVQEPARVISQLIFQEKLAVFLRQTSLDLASPVLVLADKTRLCGYPEYLPLLLSVLKQHGMDPAKLKIIISYGTHARQSDEECRLAYGGVYDDYTFIHHDCEMSDGFREVGHTIRGTPIRFRRDLLEASARITMGAVSHHYFAGYGGGRKLIVPGCGERDSIYTNHGLFLDSTTGSIAEGCQPGILDGNPLAEDLFEIEDKLPADLAIHGILDSHGSLCDIILGQGRNVFLDACKLHGQNCEITSPQFDTVIASCGGFPKDINFIQSHKAIHNASMFVRDGGQLLIYGECRDGVGSKTFLPWFKMASFDAAFKELSRHYQGNGGTALAMMTKAQRIRIGMVTSLDDETCTLIGLERWTHGRISDYLSELTDEQTLACISNASLTVKKTEMS